MIDPALFHPATCAWFSGSFDGPTRAQSLAWAPIAAGHNTLLLAPTGSGKTLAAFLAALDRLMFGPIDADRPPGVRVLYVSPLKALGVDIDRNLRAPIAGLRAVGQRLGYEVRTPTVGVRSGDTPQEDRRRMLKAPPEVLITTPESLYLLLTSKARETLAAVELVIVDEIHVMVPSKRGAHLFVTLERLERLRKLTNPDIQPLQRIGLSATQRPLDEVARLLAGAAATADPEQAPLPRPVQVVDASEPKRLDLRVETPVDDMARLAGAGFDLTGNSAGSPPLPSIWPAIHPRLVELIRQHRSTMIFVNSRRLAERLAAAINELAEEDIALAHHGSVAKDQRAAIEDRLKRGTLPAIVATSSLELGIDMGAVDLVIQIEAPPSIASGMQRIGRAGHQVGAASRGVVFPKYRGDLVACSAATGRMLRGEVEETFYPRNPLDIVAQQIVAIVAEGPISADDLFATLRGAAPLAELPRRAFEGVLDLLSGRYPSDEFAELRPRLNWDRLAGNVTPRKGTQRVAILNGGTIPDRGLYGVFIAGHEGPGARVGELDEEMVFETQPGEIFLLGASSWRVVEITRDRVLVVPAPGEPGRMPFWRGDGPGRPLEFGRAIGRLTRELVRMDEGAATQKLLDQHALEPRAAVNLLRYLQDQVEATDDPPSDATIVIESFPDEIGDWRVCVLSPFGSRVHAPWAMAVAARLRERFEDVDFSWADDGLIFRLPEAAGVPDPEVFLPDPDEVEGIVTSTLGGSSLFAARFRENAARALLLPRRRPGSRTPLWLQRRRSADLLAVASRYPGFPILLETYRECLRDVFDLPGLVGLLGEVRRGSIRVHVVESGNPSPFASTLMFHYTANFLYEGDAPLAERRAQALALDHTQLRELLGSADLRELLDADVLLNVDSELQRLSPPSAACGDDLHDLLRLLGDLSHDELAQRCDPAKLPRDQFDPLVLELINQRRVIEIRLAGEKRLAAAEDAARLRDALGAMPPMGLPYAFLEEVADPLGDLVSRYARTHGPFRAGDVALRLGTGEAQVLAVLRRLADAGRVLAGEYRPGSRGVEWCDSGVLRTIKRRSLAKLRREVEAAPQHALARLLPQWQGLHRPRRGPNALLDAIEILQGAPLLASELESEILSARVREYSSADLDELFLSGEVVWRGVEAVGAQDGRIALFLTDHYQQIAPAAGATPQETPEDTLPTAILELLGRRGALLFDEISSALGEFPNDLLAALWRLIWSGLVTNDTLAPLRSRVRGARASSLRGRSSNRRPRSGGFRSRRRPRLPGSEGRWSLLSRFEGVPLTVTQRQTAFAQQLLTRYGLVTRDAVSRENAPGGFAAVYPVLKAMEEAGRVRRGYFVEGLGGAQFAMSGADDLLRSQPRDDEPPLVLAASDPANAYGAALPWPEGIGEETSRPARAAGTRVVLDRGRLLGYLNRSSRTLITLLAEDEPQRGQDIRRLGEGLAQAAAVGRPVLLDKIDGIAASQSPLAAPLRAAGMAVTSQSLMPRSGGRR